MAVSPEIRKCLQHLLLVGVMTLVTFLQLVTLLPLGLYRCLVALFAKVFRPELGSLVDLMSSMMAFEFFVSRDVCFVIFSATIDADLSIEEVRATFQKEVLQATMSNGEMKYPTLTQFPVDFMGHLFWQREEDFRLENHVNEKLLPKETKDILEDALNTPATPNQSPWDVTLTRDVITDSDNRKKQSVITVRVGHVLADGLSVMKLFVESLGGKPMVAPPSGNFGTNPGCHQKLVWYATLPWKLIDYNVKLTKKLLQSKHHPWACLPPEVYQSKLVIGISSKVPLATLKLLGKRQGVRVASVIMSMVTSALPRFDKRLKQVGEHHLSYTLPKPGHPPHFANHAYSGPISLPNEKDLTRRLRDCDKAYDELIQGRLWLYQDVSLLLVGLWPNFVKSLVSRGGLSLAGGLTNLSAGGEEFTVCGEACSDFLPCLVLPPNSMGIFFIVLGYKESLRIVVIARENLINSSKVQELAQLVADEAEVMGEILNEDGSHFKEKSA